MGFSYLQPLIYLLILIPFCFLLVSYRHTISNMSFMVMCMSLSMLHGILLGSVIAAVPSFSFLQATGLAMVCAAAIGYLTCALRGPLIALEGLAAGIMAGMMGAMTLVMLPKQDWTAWFQFLWVLTYCHICLLIFLVAYLLMKEDQKQHPSPVGFLKQKSKAIIALLWNKPVLIFGLCFKLLFASHLTPFYTIPIDAQPTQDIEDHNNHQH